MKKYEIVLEFRKAYMKLRYPKSGMRLWELQEWAERWCEAQGVPKKLHRDFRFLVDAYAGKELQEELIEREMNKFYKQK